MKTTLLSFVFILQTLSSVFAQENSKLEIHDKATENISTILFDTKHKVYRDQLKSFENSSGIKLQFRVDNQSLDQLGGLSEHLFKLFQTFTTSENVNAKVITAEFNALKNDSLSKEMNYKTNATSDLTTCRLPINDTQKQDSLYTKFLSNGLLTTEEKNRAPESMNDMFPQAIHDYQAILHKHADCPDVFNSSSYNLHVLQTRQNRTDNWVADINALSISISTNFFLLKNSSTNTITPINSGSTKVNLFIDPKTFEGHYVVKLNESMNPCTMGDLEVRARMLYNKTGIHFLFVTCDLNYFLPVDSMNTFLDAAVQTFSTNYTDNVIVALYLKMKDGSTDYGTTTLIKQINGNWLTQADIAFANYNNGGTYQGGCVSRYNNIFKNIPKPLILCYQVAKVNGLLSTAYFIKSNEVKGKEQLYVHVFKVDKAFDELKQLQSQLNDLYVSTQGTGGSIVGTSGYVGQEVYDEIDLVINKIKIAYVKAAHKPQFIDADVRFKDVYLQDSNVVKAASLNYLKKKYGDLFKNNQFETLTTAYPAPQDLEVGACKTEEQSDVIGTGLDAASFLLSFSGLDFIPDALSVVYYASTEQYSEVAWAASAFIMPVVSSGAKKIVSSVADAIKEMNAGSKLVKEASQLKAIQQDKSLIESLFHINPSAIDANLSVKISDNSFAINELFITNEKQAKLYSNVSEKIDQNKRIEFLNKCIDEPSWRQKVLDDPDEVLRWAGVVDDFSTLLAKQKKRLDEIKNQFGNLDFDNFFPVGGKKKTDISNSLFDEMLAELNYRSSWSLSQKENKILEILASGKTLPQKVTHQQGSELYKIIKKGMQPSQTTEYWMTKSELDNLMEIGSNFESKAGLPLGSFAEEYDIYKIIASELSTAFTSIIAPTIQNGFQTIGGATQSIILNRSTWGSPVKYNTQSFIPNF